MKQRLAIIAGLVVLFFLTAGAAHADGNKVLTMSTTTSTQASGLLDVLLPALKADTGIEIKVIAKGTGAAIRDGMDGNVDVIFVHAKAREEAFVDDGYGTNRYPVMHNDFIILGPASDPAGIAGMKDAAAALKKIAQSRSKFVSRGDDSGTHTKEQDLWKATGLPQEKVLKSIYKKGKKSMVTFMHPMGLGDWYLSIGQGMGKALTYAEEKQGYILADRGTYLKYKLGRNQGLDLNILVEGDPLLYNPYGVIPVNPAKHPHVKNDLAVTFAEWITSQKGQALIANYKLLGEQLFYPDAIPDAR